jgi:hypothetical protein
MTDGTIWHPDLLRRFVPTPYIFSKGDGPSRLCVESNDLEIALSVRDSSILERQGNRAGGLLCKVIRDMAAPVDGSEVSIVSDGALRILRLGRGTILIHDLERSELLGFVSPNVKAKELASSLIPALLDLKTDESVESFAFTKK